MDRSNVQAAKAIVALTYNPRQDGSPNGRIGQFKLELGTTGSDWTTVATGTWADDATLKRADFARTSARYARLTAITEAGGRGPFTSAAEVMPSGRDLFARALFEQVCRDNAHVWNE